jgi:hypothetical protein
VVLRSHRANVLDESPSFQMIGRSRAWRGSFQWQNVRSPCPQNLFHLIAANRVFTGSAAHLALRDFRAEILRTMMRGSERLRAAFDGRLGE